MVSVKNSTIGRSFSQTNCLIWHNPKTFESVHVPAKRIFKFQTGRVMKQKLNEQ